MFASWEMRGSWGSESLPPLLPGESCCWLWKWWRPRWWGWGVEFARMLAMEKGEIFEPPVPPFVGTGLGLRVTWTGLLEELLESETSRGILSSTSQ